MNRVKRVKEELIELYSVVQLNELLDKIAVKICDYLCCEETSIFLYDPAKKELSFRIATGEKQEVLKKINLKRGEGVAGWVAEHGESVIVNDCASDPRFTAVTDLKTNFSTRSLLAVPVYRDGKLLGILECINKKKDNFDEDDRSLVENIAKYISIPLQNALLVEEVVKKERLESELKIAKQIQQSFLLDKKLDIKGLDVSYINIPSSVVGGDYFDIVPWNDDETVFTINDISGHGIPASLLMSIFRTNFVYRIKKDNNILATVCHLNDLIAETTMAKLFVTAFTCLVDIRNLHCRYINAGHNPPILIRGDKIIQLKKGGLVLGVYAGIQREVVDICLQKGDLLFLYTDGIIEAENPKGDFFTLSRLEQFLMDCNQKKLDAETIKNELIVQLKSFVQNDNFEDDVTFIAIKVKP